MIDISSKCTGKLNKFNISNIIKTNQFSTLIKLSCNIQCLLLSV